MHRFVANIFSSQLFHQTGNDEAEKRFICTAPCHSGDDKQLIDDDSPTLSAAMNSPVSKL